MKHFDLGGTGQPLHFLHANGYPPDCYKPLFELLKTEYQVFGMLLRPLWGEAKPDEIDDWHTFSEDLRVFLSSSPVGASPNGAPDPVIGVGHSVGAIVTLRTALRYPKKFRALVLLDPVLYVPRRLVEWKVQRAKDPLSHPLIQSAQKRRRTFSDLESVFTSYRERDVFRYLSDQHLRIYIEGITRKTENGYELVYSPEWESRIYFTSLQDFDIWNNLQYLRVPALFLRGEETDTFLENAAELVKFKQPKARVEVLEKATHLFPLEYPRKVFDIMQSFLREVI
ncbi:MAG: alpha/beta hydrolase [Anaerolineales bacterium]|nr:alpha/beta hydrolase [Anaerolineales bacterium]